MSVTYEPGGWTAIVCSGTSLLVELALDSPVVARCWELMSAQAGVDDVLDALVAGGIRAMPSFALVQASGSDRRIAVRGSARVLGSEHQELAAHTYGPWLEAVVQEGDVLLASHDVVSEQASVPLVGGVVLARAIRATMATPAPPITTVSAEPVAPEPDRLLEIGTPDRPHPPVGTETSPPVVEADVSALRAEHPVETIGSYDHLFGATQRPEDITALTVPPPLSPPAPPPPAPAPPPDDAPPFPAQLVTSPPPTAEPSATRPSPSPGLMGQIIDAVPWASSAERSRPRAVSRDAGPPVIAPQEDGADLTVARAQVVDLAASGGPTVLGASCPAGHLSSARMSVCRVCQAPMPDQPGFPVARPSLGLLRLSTGDVVRLDRGVLFGRAPSVPDDQAPSLNAIRLASPDKGLSRNHAEIELDDWEVYVKDLGSMNGTVITLPGQKPVRLRPQDPHLLEAGAQVVLGDEVILVYEVTE